MKLLMLLLETMQLKIEGSLNDKLANLFLGVRHDPVFLKDVLERNIIKFQQELHDFDEKSFMEFLY